MFFLLCIGYEEKPGKSILENTLQHNIKVYWDRRIFLKNIRYLTVNARKLPIINDFVTVYTVYTSTYY